MRLKATNADGLWNDAGTAISIRVIPPFWRANWFYLIYVLLGAAFVYGIMRFRLRQARQRERALQKQVDERTEELRLANLKLQELATTDELTGVANYRRFRDFLDYEWRRAARNKKPVSLLLADLDDFKQFNDTLGHQAGDECLRRVAQAMISACRRPSDLVCRYGGDEFAVVLAETNLAGAGVVAEKIRSKIEQLVIDGVTASKPNEFSFYGESKVVAHAELKDDKTLETKETKRTKETEETKDKKQPQNGEQANDRNLTNYSADVMARRITVCIGCASLNPAEGGNVDELIALADRALYKAKSSGKNKTCL